MNTRHITHSDGAGDYDNGPIYPDDIPIEHSHSKKGCFTAIIVSALTLIALSLASAIFFAPWWVEAQVALHYTPYSHQVTVATITSSRTGAANTSKVLISTSLESKTMNTNAPYILRCKNWRLHADILTTPSIINTPSHSWYQLTTIEGSQCLDEHGNPIPYDLHTILGSDDSFGKDVLNGTGFGIVSAKEVTSNFVPVDGKTYNVIITPTGLSLIAAH